MRWSKERYEQTIPILLGPVNVQWEVVLLTPRSDDAAERLAGGRLYEASESRFTPSAQDHHLDGGKNGDELLFEVGTPFSSI